MLYSREHTIIPWEPLHSWLGVVTSYSVVLFLQKANISAFISTTLMALRFIILAACLAAGMELNETCAAVVLDTVKENTKQNSLNKPQNSTRNFYKNKMCAGY